MKLSSLRLFSPMTNSVARLLTVILMLTAGFLPVGSASTAAELPVYSDGLTAGWDDWSWDTTVNFANTSPVYSGATSLAATNTAGWAGLYLDSNIIIPGADYDTLEFWINGGSKGGQKLRVMLADGNHDLIGSGVAVVVGTGGWTQVKIMLAKLGSPAIIRGICWQDTSGGAQPTFYLDRISFTGQAVTPPPPQGVGPALVIDAGAARHPISEDIYGMNFADEGLAAELRLPVSRWGGNRTTRYNWQNDTANHDRDWYYESLPEDNPSPSLLPDGSTADRFVEQNRRTNTKSLITVPLIGWTPGARAVACGFSVAKYGPQQSTDPWEPDCGNGVRPDGTLITSNDPYDTSIPVGPDFAKAWVGHLAGKYGNASNGGVTYYNLDNEPMLWDSMHRDVHPQPVTYDEMRDRTYQYAPAIKAADPSARTLGPVAYGWCEYFYSALDGCNIGPDYQSHGNTPYVAWYLQQMRAYEQQTGVRILDYLDLHYYPQADNVALSPAGDAITQTLRLRSTRSLWDPAYMDESWVNNAVRLVPRMREWVNTNYPGTKLAVTEYNWGGHESINGALAQADVLGIFGREGLDLATIWEPPTAAQPGAFAFRIYRNYDGAGHGFGDMSVQATSAEQDTLAVYASERSSDKALTAVVINKTAHDLTSGISLAGFIPASTATVYRYSASNPGAIMHLADQPVIGSGFSATLPGNSITLFVMTTGGTINQALTISKAGTGSGSVTADTGTISWSGNTGTGTYSNTTLVTLTATASAGSTFAGWTGCNATVGNQCSVIMNAAKTVSAAFTAATCRFSISPATQVFSRFSGSSSVRVTASSGSCTWKARSNVSWITVTSGSAGTGNGTVKYSVSRNSTGNNRTGTITIAGLTFTVTRAK